MTDANINLGFHALNVPEAHAPRTAVVLGLPRGGTSMVAGALYYLGIDMGDNFNTTTFEDRPLSAAVEQGRTDELRRIVADRNARSEVWGWKRPSSRNNVDIIKSEFRNPYFLLIFRDVLAIALRKNLSVESDVVQAMRANARAQRQLIDLVTTLEAPLLLLSYEKCLGHPREAAEAMASFLGTPVTEQALAFIEPDSPTYINNTRRD